MKDIEIKIPPFCDGIKSIFNRTTETIINKFKESMKNYTLNVIIILSLIFILMIACILNHFIASVIAIILISCYFVAACSEFDNNHTKKKVSINYLKKYDYNDYCNNEITRLAKHVFYNIKFNKNISLYEIYKLILNEGIIIEIKYIKYSKSWCYRYWNYNNSDAYLVEQSKPYNTYTKAFEAAIHEILIEMF